MVKDVCNIDIPVKKKRAFMWYYFSIIWKRTLWSYIKLKKGCTCSEMNWESPFVRRYVDAIWGHKAIGCHPHFRWTVVHHLTPGEAQEDAQRVNRINGSGAVVSGVEALSSDCDNVIYAERHEGQDMKHAENIKYEMCETVRGLSYSTYLWSRGWAMVLRCTRVSSWTKWKISTWLL